MDLPFDLPRGYLPVIVRRPKVKSRELLDGTKIFEALNIRYLDLKSDRGLFDIGLMLDIRQFAMLTRAERYTLLSLQRRLDFSAEITFPNLDRTGELFAVDGSDGRLVWATIPAMVIVTRKFTILDLHDKGMALDEPDVLQEVVEQRLQGCPDAELDELMQRFADFKPPHRTDISRAVRALERLGIIREVIGIGRYHYRAVFNMRLVAATRSGIVAGMIAAEDQLRRFDESTVFFETDLKNATSPTEPKKATRSGRRRKLTRADYQAISHKERAARIKLERKDRKANKGPKK